MGLRQGVWHRTTGAPVAVRAICAPPGLALLIALLIAAGSCAAAPRSGGPGRPAPKPAAPPPAPCERCPQALTPDGRALAAGLTGVIKPEGEAFVLEGCAGRTRLEGILGETVQPLVGRQAWLNVMCTGENRAAALGGHALGDSVVDLFVMGLCPAARALERQIAQAMQSPDSASLPRIRLHAIFFARESAGAQVVFAKHGEEEMRENVVQLSLQELEPARLWAYLGVRAGSDEAWTALAGRVGVSWRTVAEIQRRLDHELLERTETPWRDTALNWPSIDASPTVFWLGRPVRDITDVPGFQRMSMTQEPCTK